LVLRGLAVILEAERHALVAFTGTEPQRRVAGLLGDHLDHRAGDDHAVLPLLHEGHAVLAGLVVVLVERGGIHRRRARRRGTFTGLGGAFAGLGGAVILLAAATGDGERESECESSANHVRSFRRWTLSDGRGQRAMYSPGNAQFPRPEPRGCDLVRRWWKPRSDVAGRHASVHSGRGPVGHCPRSDHA